MVGLDVIKSSFTYQVVNEISGTKRVRDEEMQEMAEIYGEYGASMGDRVKRRRRKANYVDSDEDEVMILDEEPKKKKVRHYSDNSRSPSPEGKFLYKFVS